MPIQFRYANDIRAGFPILSSRALLVEGFDPEADATAFAGEIEHPEIGEVIFADQVRPAHARRGTPLSDRRTDA